MQEPSYIRELEEAYEAARMRLVDTINIVAPGRDCERLGVLHDNVRQAFDRLKSARAAADDLFAEHSRSPAKVAA